MKILQKLASRNNNGGWFGSQALTEHSSTCDPNTQQELGKSSCSLPATLDQAEKNSNTQNRVLLTKPQDIYTLDHYSALKIFYSFKMSRAHYNIL